MATSEFERNAQFEQVMQFERHFATSQASSVIDLGWGYALRQLDFPLSHYHNRVVVTDPAPAPDILETVEEVLAHVQHRYLSVDDDELGQTLTAEFEAAGYEHETIAAMVYSGPLVEPSTHDVQAVSLDKVQSAVIRDWRDELPTASNEALRQLAGRKALYARGAEFTPLAVFERGEIAAHADLYIDRQRSLAQFESLVTGHAFRGNGYGDALVRDALRRGQQADCDLFFLTADLDDWPHRWYQRLGFVEVGRTHHFSRMF